MGDTFYPNGPCEWQGCRMGAEFSILHYDEDDYIDWDAELCAQHLIDCARVHDSLVVYCYRAQDDQVQLEKRTVAMPVHESKRRKRAATIAEDAPRVTVNAPARKNKNSGG